MILLFIIGLALVIANFAYFRLRDSATVALGTSMIVAFCLPAYWEIEFLSTPFPFHTVAAIALLLAFVGTGGSLALRLNVIDLAVGSMAVVHVISDLFVHQGIWIVPFRAYGEWILIYAAGRYGFDSWSSIEKAKPHLIGFFAIALVVWGLDLTINRNVYFELTESISDWQSPRRAKRFSLVRSAGLASHPIFFSGLMIAMLPFLVASFRWRGQFKTTLRYLVAAALLGLGCVLLSRGAVLAIGISAFGLFATLGRKQMLMVLIPCLLVLALTVAQWDRAKELWYRTGDFSDQRQRVVTIDGQEKIHSSTLARLRLFDIYGRAAFKAGLFGYGTDSVAEFPPNLPYLPKEADVLETIPTVENSYLLSLLRFGWLGLIAFCYLNLSPVWAVITTVDLDRRHQCYLFVAGSMALALLLATVYWDYQFVAAYLFLLGTISGLVDPRRKMLEST